MSPLRINFWPSGEEDWVPPPSPLEVFEEEDIEFVQRIAGQITEVATAVAILAGGLAQVEPEELWFEPQFIAEEEALPVQPVVESVYITFGQNEDEYVIAYLEDESGQISEVEKFDAVLSPVNDAEEEFVTNFTLDDALEETPRSVVEVPILGFSEDEELPEQVVDTIIEDESGLIPDSIQEEITLGIDGEQEFPFFINVDEEISDVPWIDGEVVNIPPAGIEEELPVIEFVPEDESGLESVSYEESLTIQQSSDAEELAWTIPVDEISPDPAPWEDEVISVTLQDDTIELPEPPVGIPDDFSGELPFVVASEVEVIHLVYSSEMEAESGFVVVPTHIWKLYRKSQGVFWPLTP